MFLMDNRQANRDWDSCLEGLKGLLAKHGAEVQRVDKWGERRLAYEIKGRRRGTYVLLYFTATGTAVTEIYRECELSELTLRALIVKAAKLPDEVVKPAPLQEAAPAAKESASDEEAPKASEDDVAE
jgi:small subunit ribosomal protein S6